MDRLKRKLKDYLNIWLFISFVLTILVPFTGIYIHKLAAALFLVLAILHAYVYRKKLKMQKYLLIAVVIICFASGILGKIFDEYTIILTIHKVLAVFLIISIAVHVFTFIKNKGKIKE